MSIFNKRKTLKVKLDFNAKTPSYAYRNESNGLDLIASSLEYDTINDRIIYHTGVHIQLAKDEVGFIIPNSRISKTDWFLANSPGDIDHGYSGEIRLIYKNRLSITSLQKLDEICDKLNISKISSREAPFKPGEVVGQLVICKYVHKRIKIVDKIKSGKRGNGTEGSSKENTK